MSCSHDTIRSGSKKGGFAVMSGKTLYEKICDQHLVRMEEDGTGLLYIDRHLVHEVTSPQAFDGLRDCLLYTSPSPRDRG